MDYMDYNRSFIMLEEQGRQYAAKQTAPIKGYLKIETENNAGKICCVVQNLKHFDTEDYIYKLIVFGVKNDNIFHVIIGDLAVDDQNSAEAHFTFEPSDVDGEGKSYQELSVAAIVTASTKDSNEQPEIVLKGFFSEEKIEPLDSKFFR